MSTSIDERIVSMQFDNRQFERNAQASIQTLDKLNKSLRLEESAKGFENITNAGKKVDFTPMTQSLEKVQTKFSALQTTAAGALLNIGNSIAAFSKNLVTSLTITPISTGLSEYETQLNSVQTILANTQSKGSTLEDVNSALDELNVYADKTIYNFQEMARNIGTFTAAGVDLDKSVSSIKGIANLAAVSGSSSQQASVAMYQLSQALAAGRVSLMDWNSVVNAGMGGQVFQDALKRTAENMGTNVDALIEKYGSFRESLTQGEWLTADVLTETLSQLAGAYDKADLLAKGYSDEQANEILKLAETAESAATKVKTFTQLTGTLQETAQSGWAQTFEILIGDFEEAKKLWTDINNVVGGWIDSTSKWRNELMMGALGTGWEKFTSAYIPNETDFQSSMKTVLKRYGVVIDESKNFRDVVTEGFRDGSITAEMLTKSIEDLYVGTTLMTDEEREALGYTKDNIKALRELNDGLKNGSVSAEDLANSFGKISGRELLIKSLGNVFKFLGDLIKPVKEAFTEVFSPPTAKGIYSVLEALHKFTSKLKVSSEVAAGIKLIFKTLFSTMSLAWEIMKAVSLVAVKLTGALFGLSGGVLFIIGKLSEYIDALRNVIKNTTIFEKGADKVSEVISLIGNKIKEFTSSVRNAFSNIDFGPFLTTMSKLWEVVKNVFKLIGNALKEIGQTIGEAFNITDIDSFLDFLNGALTTGGLAAIIAFFTSLRNSISSGGGIVSGITDILTSVRGCFEEHQRSIKADVLHRIATATLILAGALLIISLIDTDKLLLALHGMAATIAMMMVALRNFGKITHTLGNMVKGVAAIGGITIAILGLAGALYIIAKAITLIGGLETEQVRNGIGVIAVAMAGISVALLAFSIALRSIPAGSRMISMASSLVVLSAAFALFSVGMIGLATAMVIMSRIKAWDAVRDGLFAVGALGGFLIGLMVATRLIPSTTSMVKFGASMILIGASLVIVAGVFKIMETIERSSVGKGIAIFGALGLFLSGLMAATKLVPPTASIVKLGAAMILMSVALAATAGTFKIIETMDWETLGKGGAVVAGLGLILSGLMAATKLVPKTTSIVKFGAAIILMSTALSAIAGMLKIMETISWSAIAKGAVAIGTMGLFLSGLMAAMKLVPSTTSIIKFGTAILLMSASLNLVATALKVIEGISWSNIFKGVVGLGLVLAAMTAAIRLLGTTGSAITNATGLLILSAAVISLAGAMRTLSYLSWGGIGRGLVTIAGSLALLIGAGLIVQRTGLAATLLTLAIAMAIASTSMILIGVGLQRISEGFLAALNTLHVVIAGILSLIPDIVTVVLEFILAITKALADNIPGIANNILQFILGVLTALVAYIPDIASRILDLIIGITEVIISYTPRITELLIEGLVSIIDGLTKGTPEVVRAITGFIETLFRSISDSFETMDLAVIYEGTKAVAALTGMVAMLAVAAAMVPLAVIGVIGMVAIIAEVAAVASLFEGHLDKLAIVGEAIGIFMGSFVGAFLENMSYSLPAIAEQLSDFMKEITPFFEGINNISENAIIKAGILALVVTMFGVAAVVAAVGQISSLGGMLRDLGTQMSDFMKEVRPFFEGLDVVRLDALLPVGVLLAVILLFAAANVIAAVTNIASLGLGLGTMAKELSTFMTNLEPFLAKLALVDPAIIESAKSLAEMVLIFSAASFIDGIGRLLPLGKSSMGDFGRKLVPFGDSMAKFAEKVKGVDGDQVKGVAEACKLLAETADTIPNSGGLVAAFAGENDINVFGNQINTFGTFIQAFAEKVKDVKGDQVQGAADALFILTDAANKIPNSGGLAGAFAGENDMDVFGKQMSTFGTFVQAFAEKVKDVKGDQVQGAADALLILVQAAKEIPNSGGVASWFAGENDIDVFGNKLNMFADRLIDFNEKMTGVTAESAEKCVDIIDAIRRIIDDMPDVTRLELIKEQLLPFGNAVVNFANKLNEIDTVDISSNSNAVKNAVTNIAEISGACMNGFTEGIEGSDVSIVNAVADAMYKVVNTIHAKKITIDNAIRSMLKSALATISSTHTNFVDAGKNLVAGFASGIEDNKWIAEAKAKAMAEAALEAARDVLDINSPSKKFYEVGEFAGEGLSNALSDYESKAYGSGSSLAESAMYGLKKAISKIKEMVENGIDGQPTIRPVLDLSNISEGVGTIGNMLNIKPSLGAMSNLGNISAMMNGKGQNGTNNDIISAINGLSERLGNVSGDTYNIDGITYNDSSAIDEAVKVLIRAIKMEGRM